MKLEGYLYQGKFYKSLEDLNGRTFSEADNPVQVYSGDLKEFAREAIDLGLSLGTTANRRVLNEFIKENVTE